MASPERGPRGAEDFARVEPELMQPLEGLERRIVAPGEARRPRQTLDVVGVERPLRARLRQSVIGIAPCPSLVGAPPLCGRLVHGARAGAPCSTSFRIAGLSTMFGFATCVRRLLSVLRGQSFWK